jgi:hypothetical protein
MKITVKRTETDVEVEGEAHEIREAVPAILANATPAPGTELAPPAASPLALEAGDDDVVVEGEAVDDRIRTAADIQIDPDETMPDVPDAPVPSRGYQPEEEWQQVPTSRRVWGANSTLHIAREPGGLDLYCSHTVGGTRRPRNWKPVPYVTAKVCGSCNGAIVREARP